MDANEARRIRAAARSSLPVRRVDLRAEGGHDELPSDPSERVAMVWAVTLDAWASSGQVIPGYGRGAAPGRMLRGSTRAP